MEKLRLALIGQGRSGKKIHGAYLRSDANPYFTVRYVVDADEESREQAKSLHPGCETFADYRALFDKEDVDLVVNASYSHMHYPITKDLLEHGKNVLVEKPFARNLFECRDLIETARRKGVLLAVFQQTFLAPFYLETRKKLATGVLGRIEQISIRYNGYARRWDWQTLQKNMGGSVYNTGPHPIGLALGFLDFDPQARVVFSRLACDVTSGDAEDYAKILFAAPDKPLIDLEISAVDPFTPYTLAITGTRGALTTTAEHYDMQYWTEAENPARPLVFETLRDEDHQPIYCSEEMVWHRESGDYKGTAFNSAVASFYEDLYYALTEKKPMRVTPEMAAAVVAVIEKVHADNPLPMRFW